MIITEVKSEDQGDYLVRAENEFGRRECSAMLNVLMKDGKSRGYNKLFKMGLVFVGVSFY